MEKEEIIKKLKVNHYSFNEKDDQIIISLTDRCRFIITLSHEEMINYQEIIRSSVFFKKDVPLKSELKNMIISTIVLILFSLGYSYIEEDFSMIKNPFFWVALGSFLASSTYILYYRTRFTRIKKLLNLS
ncbi:hypothetical protein FACS189440_05570 [Bacteroidia bacterium]|nr:hypothetical protein FACS189423_01480 [Bacteroidia bacterium]GHT46786.1 hypothetical protein FACS189440_05570 [Bacteroidia bacterium]